MTRHQKYFNKPVDWPVFYFFYYSFLCCERLFRRFGFYRYLKEWFWQVLKGELLYIDGTCQKCGACCHHIMITHLGKSIDTIYKYQRLIEKDDTYKRLVPIYKDNQNIHYYWCKSLSNQTHCMDYETRLPFCRHYPLNYFLMDQNIPKECGFFISTKAAETYIANHYLLKKMKALLNENVS